jgi:hypothetical protein
LVTANVVTTRVVNVIRSSRFKDFSFVYGYCRGGSHDFVR